MFIPNQLETGRAFDEDKYSDNWIEIQGDEPNMLNDLARDAVSKLILLGCRVSYQRSIKAGDEVISINGPPTLLTSKEFDNVMRSGNFFLQPPLRPDINNIRYENPQWLKFDKSKGCPFTTKGTTYIRKVINTPEGYWRRVSNDHLFILFENTVVVQSQQKIFFLKVHTHQWWGRTHSFVNLFTSQPAAEAISRWWVW